MGFEPTTHCLLDSVLENEREGDNTMYHVLENENAERVRTETEREGDNTMYHVLENENGRPGGWYCRG